MSYISRKQSYRLIQSNNIAVLSSIAIHVLILGMVLPNLNFASDIEKSDDSRTVKIRQLNELELRRLPNFKPDPIELPNSIKPNSPPAEKSLTSIYPDLNQLESKLLDKSNFNSRQSGSNLTVSPLPIPALPANSNRLPPPPPAVPSIISLTKPLQSRLPQPVIEQPKTQAKVNSPRVTSPQSLEYPLSQTEIADFRQRLLQAKMQERVRSIKKDLTNTTDREALRNYLSWLVKVKKVEPEKLALAGTYPQDICARQLTATVIYGVSVNESGEASDIYLIKSSGYQIFDSQAKQDINSQTLKPEKIYRIDLNFKPNQRICSDLSVS